MAENKKAVFLISDCFLHCSAIETPNLCDLSRFFSEDPIHLYIRRVPAPEVLFTPRPSGDKRRSTTRE